LQIYFVKQIIYFVISPISVDQTFHDEHDDYDDVVDEDTASFDSIVISLTLFIGFVVHATHIFGLLIS
jgi:hypothetical protein